MRRLTRALAAIILAVTTLYFAVVRPESEDGASEPVSDSEPTAPVYDDSDELAMLNERRRACEAEELAEREKALLAENRRTAVRKAGVNKPKQVTVSRGSGYVGQAQTFEATAYTAYCAGCTGITKTGHDLRKSIYKDGRRVIAVDPRWIPLGSIVRVTLADGTTFEAVASDTGGLIKGAIIDVAHETKGQAREFGRQTVEVRFIKRGGR